MRSHRHLVVLALVTLVAAPAVPSAAQSPDNPWAGLPFLNIAHRGGASEGPEETLFTYAKALEAGTDMLEADLHATSDGEVIAMHDATVDRTTDGSGRVDSMTLAQIRTLDAGHDFRAPDGTFPYRGIATGAVPPPAGFTPDDFRVPTLRELLTRFPDVPFTLEIKSGAPETAPYHQTVADILRETGRARDVVVASFVDSHLEAFKLAAPDVSTATATGQTAAFWASIRGPLPGAPNPRYHALQVPLNFAGIEVVDRGGEFVRKAHANGFVVHVWTVNDRPTMEWLLDIGVDGIMTDRPTLLAQVVRERA
ncbi:MAG TPA: glycerophosphodiester phosphodiesterase [Actinomycetota bacterium]|nr:glycerophosphodiester phosphodiesterase [Actinomycetota bacterium]